MISNTGRPEESGIQAIGRAANRWVTFQIVLAVIGGVLFLVFLFAFFLPAHNRIDRGLSRIEQNQPTIPGVGQPNASFTINGRPATEEERRLIEQHLNEPLPANA